MPHKVGDVFTSHAGWRLAVPDSDADRLIFPADCPGDLVVDSIVGDLLCLECTNPRCRFEVSTRRARQFPHVDARTQSQGVDPIPF